MGERTTVIGTILAVVFQNEENGYTVARIVTDDGEPVTVVGCIPCAAPGEELILTGSAVVQNGVLTLPGANQTGSMTTLNLSLRDSDWTTAKLWLRCSIGNENVVTPYLNGNEMARTGTSIDRSATGVQCAEREYTWEGEGVSHAELRLELASGSKAMSVYDYFIVFW